MQPPPCPGRRSLALFRESAYFRTSIDGYIWMAIGLRTNYPTQNQFNMARFNYSGVAVTGGTGRLNSSLGGTVLMKNGVVRSYTTPTNPQSSGQIQTRNQFSYLQTTWGQTLTEAQRTSWDAAAASGDWQIQDPFTGSSRNPKSGKDLFTTLCMNAWLADGKSTLYMDEVPAKISSSGLALGAINAAAGAGTFTIAFTGMLGNSLVISASAPGGAGQMKMRKANMRWVRSAGAPQISPFNFAANYTAAFGSLTGQEGKKIFVLVEEISIDTGQRWLVGSGNVVVAA